MVIKRRRMGVCRLAPLACSVADGAEVRQPPIRPDRVIEDESLPGEKGANAPRAASRGNDTWNILLVVCDDLNTHVSPSGYDPIHTPTLARLASESLTFRRAFCQYPVCGPSRASFLSGLYPESTGVLDNTADIRKERPRTLSMPQFFIACVSFVDAQFKIVFDSLKESGHWDDTIVVLTSDHGYHLGDHFLWGKVTLFDIGAMVPFIVRVPGLTRGGTLSEAMVDLVDIYPTLADLTGLTPPDQLQGASLRPLLGHPDRMGSRKSAYTVVSRGRQLGYALRNQRWRYGKWPDGEELYDLTSDPEEKHNLAGKPRVAERLKEFRNLLAEKQREAGSRRQGSPSNRRRHEPSPESG